MNKQNSNWQLIWLLTTTDFKLRYYGSFLGFLWAFLKPLCIFIVLNFVFIHLFGSTVSHFSVKLFIGLILFNFFAEGTTLGMTSLTSKAYILKKIKIPHWTIVVASTLQVLLSCLINLVIILLFLWWDQIIPNGASVLWFLVYIGATYLLILSFSFISSIVYVFIRDLNQIWEVLLQILFYTTPIIYPLSILPDSYQRFFLLNPLTFLVENSKLILVDQVTPNWFSSLVFLLIVFVVLGISCLSFLFFSRHINEQL